MPIKTIPYRTTGYFNKLICDYLDKVDVLKPFYGRFPDIRNFNSQIVEKAENYPPSNRELLSSQIQAQYQGFKVSPATSENIQSLKSENTFTITTGHQLNLFSGPLYFLYKIISVINLCERLNNEYSNHHFVPVYWMATEDHDFEEINFFRCGERRVEWDRTAGGAVGKLNTSGLDEIHGLLKEIFGESPYALELLELFRSSYLENSDLAAATRELANSLFGDQGLVIVDGDDIELKRLFVPYAKEEITERTGFHKITESTKKLDELGYHKQVHPREINLFYLQEGSRERIIFDRGTYYINNSEVSFSPKAMITELNSHPERFSPNALLRPLYQEVILPNLCYIGGGGELSYWFQLKSYFESSGLTFPLLMLRNSALLLPSKYRDKLERLGMKVEKLFLDPIELEKLHTRRISSIDIDFSKQKKHLQKQFRELYGLAEKTDKSFLGAVAAQEKKQLNGLDKLEKRLMRAQRRKLRDELDRLRRVQEKLFPGQNLQERHCNFSEFYLQYGPGLIEAIQKSLDPLCPEFTVIRL